jgi:arsenate reductase-like glutaredoxin family protein
MLIELIESKKVELILTSQVEDEFYRNRASAIKDVRKKLRDLKAAFKISYDLNSFPSYVVSDKGKQSFKEIVKKFQEDINAEINNLEDKYEEISAGPKSSTDALIKILFNHARQLVPSDEILLRAQFRTLKGNPPRKDNNSFGDAINWELLLQFCLDDDLVIVSGDGDYSSTLDSQKIDEFIEFEWAKYTDKKLTLFTSFGEFLNKINKSRVIASEEIKEEKSLVEQYTNSPSEIDSELLEHLLEFLAPVCAKCNKKISTRDGVWVSGVMYHKHCTN